jgi:hypothetical protein
MSIDSGANAAIRPRQTVSGQCDGGFEGEADAVDMAKITLNRGEKEAAEMPPVHDMPNEPCPSAPPP